MAFHRYAFISKKKTNFFKTRVEEPKISSLGTRYSTQLVCSQTRRLLACLQPWLLFPLDKILYSKLDFRLIEFIHWWSPQSTFRYQHYAMIAAAFQVLDIRKSFFRWRKLGSPIALKATTAPSRVCLKVV